MKALRLERIEIVDNSPKSYVVGTFIDELGKAAWVKINEWFLATGPFNLYVNSCGVYPKFRIHEIELL